MSASLAPECNNVKEFVIDRLHMKARKLIFADGMTLASSNGIVKVCIVYLISKMTALIAHEDTFVETRLPMNAQISSRTTRSV